MNIRFIISASFMLCAGIARSQSASSSILNAAGGSNIISGNTYEFSIGEMTLVNTFSSPGVIVTQGVLQPMSQTNNINDKNFLADNMSIFPNPTNEDLYLQPKFQSGGELSYQLYDGLGRIVMKGNFKLSTGKEKQFISLKSLAASTYTLSLNFEQGERIFNVGYKVQKLQ